MDTPMECYGLLILSNMSPARRRKIMKWNEGYRAAVSYALLHGTTAVLQEAVHEGIKVGHWIRNRRAEYQRGTLSEEAVLVISKIPHWTWDPYKEAWLRKYELLKEAHQVMGDRCFSTKASYAGVAIGRWVRTQRNSRAIGVLSFELIARLEELPFWSWGRTQGYRRPSTKSAGKRRQTTLS